MRQPLTVPHPSPSCCASRSTAGSLLPPKAASRQRLRRINRRLRSLDRRLVKLDQHLAGVSHRLAVNLVGYVITIRTAQYQLLSQVVGGAHG